MDSIVSSLTEDEFHHDHDENGAQVGLTEPLLLKEPTIPEDGPMLPSRNTVAHVTPRYNDQRIKMTYGRRISRFLRNCYWYNPQRHNNNVSLDDGWAFFEHITLARHFIPEEGNERLLDRADPGEWNLPTQLYRVWSTPHDQLGDFGIGIGIYFDTTLWLAYITLAAGCMSIFNMYYYNRGGYTSDNQESVSQWILKGSAVCNDQVWVPCMNCAVEEWESGGAPERIATNEDSSLLFALRNECKGTELPQGIMTLGIFVFLVVALQILTWRQRKTEVLFDLDEQTAQDYSIMVDHAPPDATNPDEWKDFFTEVSESKVSLVTVALDNRTLLETLVEHRMLREELESEDMAQVTRKLWGSRVENEADIREMLANLPNIKEDAFESCFRKVGLNIDPLPKYRKFIALKDRIRKLVERDYEVSDVFVTFETEAGQRKALESLSVGKLSLFCNRANIPDYCKFRGEDILDIIEAPEPNAVRWMDLAMSRWQVASGLIISTSLIVVLTTIWCTFIVWRTWNEDHYVPIYISAMNGMVPFFCTKVMSYETHQAAGDRSTSLFLKLTLFRWANTVVLVFMATPFTTNLSDGAFDLLPYMVTIFCVELIWGPAFALTDVIGNFKRHYLAPREKSQDAVNAHFRGNQWDVAERYTVVTKQLFMCLCFSVLFPAGCLLCSAALFLTYFTDKFSLMRSWAPAPMIGNEVAEMNRTVFLPLCLVAAFIINGYHYARFPYDNLCETKYAAGDTYAGSYTIYTSKHNHTVDVDISTDDSLYEYCNQNILTQGIFPPSAKAQGDFNWMGDEDEVQTVNIFGWVGFAVAVSYLFLNYGISFIRYLDTCFRSQYTPSGEDMKINFSSVKSISAYIPQIRLSNIYNFPLLATNFEDVDPKLIDWDDPIGGRQKWDIRQELPDDVMHQLKREHKTVFSVVKHYNKPNYLKLLEKQLRKLQRERRSARHSVISENQDNASLAKGASAFPPKIIGLRYV